MKIKPRWQALTEGCCPRCGQDKMFSHSALSPTNFDKMHEKCDNCQLHYEVEPGFFIGAMYVSYLITVGLMLVTGFLLFFLAGDPEAWVYVATVVGVVVLPMPLVFRASRVLYIYWFSGVDYDPKSFAKPLAQTK
jgi:uncharacterized protein (DUF983 family)